MKKSIIIALAILLGLPLHGGRTASSPRTDPQDPHKGQRPLSQKHPDPLLGIPYYSRKKVYEANIWTRAVYFEGLMALHSIYPDNRYYDYAYNWADGFDWGMRRDDTTTRNADNYCAAQTYIDLYNLTPEPRMLTKTKACMNMLVNTPQVDDWTWIDSYPDGVCPYWPR